MNILKCRNQIHQNLLTCLDLENRDLAFFCHFYGLDDLLCDIELLKLENESGTNSWVAWHFKNETKVSKGYALITHGLFDHSAYMKPLIRSLLNEGLNVLALELPGHGLDFKKGLDCEDFNEYTESNKSAVQWIKDQDQSLLVEIAHSTGCVGRLNRLLQGDIPKHSLVFLNPLVKIQMFKLAKTSYKAFSGLLRSVPRKKRGVGESREFINTRERDPLQVKKIPMKWAKSYFAWMSFVSSFKTQNSVPKLLIILGQKDYIVNPKESLRFFRRKFSRLKTSCYSNIGHQPLYTGEEDVQRLLSEINSWWKKNSDLNSFQ